MGDVYDDLENYEQETIIKELRDENKELKFKLEEYASTLDTLQKDFDKLSTEYKKLELNYSSLLKTARAEIERKTTIITNLNVEKDKLVISALQNKGRVQTNNQNKARNIASTLQTEIQPVKAVACDKGKNETSNETDRTAPEAGHNDRKKTFDKKSLSSSSLKSGSDSTEKGLKPKTANNDRNNDKDKTETKEIKPNQFHDLVDEKSIFQGKKIYNRRKSMPLFNRGDIQFSSEDEQEENPRYRSERDRFKRKAPSRDFNERNHDNDRMGRSGPRVSDFKRVDEKYANYHDSSRDYHKSYSRHHENDRYRIKDNKDKYDSNQRSRRHYSPNRSYYNTRKEYSNEKAQRSDTVSHRILESPPPDKYNQYRKSRDGDRRRFQNEETMKHKIHDIMEEPECKRMRTESLNRQINEHVNLPPDRDIGGHIVGTQPAQFSYLFLQSPDHVHLEHNAPVHPVKEIKGTAATELEDPRLKSQKYVLKTHQDEVTLSTVFGRDVDIKFVDTTIWGKDKDKDKDKLKQMPTPLREKPQTPEDLVKDIYMDIDNPILNLSFESGEIDYSEDDLRLTNINKNISEANTGEANPAVTNLGIVNTGGVKTGVASSAVADTGTGSTGIVIANVNNTGEDNTEVANTGLVTTNVVTLKTQEKCNKPVNNKIQSHQIQENNKQVNNPTDIVQKSPSFFNKYIIPKINKPNTHKPLEDVITNIMHKLDKKEQCEKYKTDKNINETDKSIEKEFDTHNPLKLFSSSRQICENKSKDELIGVRRGKHSPEKPVSSARDTVEGDLELSDETSDCTEFIDQMRYNKEKNVLPGEGTSNVTDIEHKETCDNEKQISVCKQRKDFKHGIETMFDNKHSKAPVTLAEGKLHESEKCNDLLKDKTKDMKTKLCDLFGDSSSLITPDDLGIIEPPIANQIVNDCVPLFDNTQDAVDLNVEDMEKVQTRSLKEFDKSVVNNEHQDAKQDKKQKNKASKTNNEGKKKPKNYIDKKSATEHVVRSDNTGILNEEPNIVKTIIISTGVQNNCNSDNFVPDKGKESQLLGTLGKVNNNVPNCQSLPNLKALATSTPHKITRTEPTLPLPNISCNSNNTLATNNVGSSSKTEDIGKTAQNNLDVPDVRIIIKRRRKGKSTTPC